VALRALEGVGTVFVRPVDPEFGLSAAGAGGGCAEGVWGGGGSDSALWAGRWGTLVLCRHLVGIVIVLGCYSSLGVL
jgi:hypothetical protein